MSQKPTHNSKRRPPGENVEGDQQDADWGFDSDQADPAVEKKLAVALVVCLLAGFGFVFYQKFRLLRNDDVQQVSVDAQVEQVESTTSGGADPGHDDQTLAQRSAVPEAPAEPSPTSADLQSPFYERDETDSSPPDADAGWTLAQTELAQSPPSDSQATELPPLPDAGAANGFDPFAADREGITSAPATAGQGASPAETTSAEPPMLVWDDPAAEAAPAQSEPELVPHPEPEPEPEPATAAEPAPHPAPDALPEIAPQRSPANRAAQPDPFAFDIESTDSSESPSRPETPAPSRTDKQSTDEPQMLIRGDSHESSEQSDGEAAAMEIEPLPVRSKPRPVEAVDADETDEQSPDGSGFDPFVGAAEGDDSATTTGSSPPAPQPEPPRSGTNETAAPNMFDPFPSADSPSPALTEPSMDIASEPGDNPQPASDPFSFPASAADPPRQSEPSAGNPPQAGKPTFEPFPAAAASGPTDPAPAPTWPQGSSSPSGQTLEDPGTFRSPDEAASARAAPQPSSPPESMTFEPPEVEAATAEPIPAAVGESRTPTSAAAPNPFSFDAGPSRPIVNPPHDAQRVVGEREITVTPSDSFWSISEREYGSSRYFNALARYNKERVSKPELLQSGMKLVIPPPEVLEDRFPELFQRTAEADPTISPLSGGASPAPPAGLFVDEMQRPFYRVGEKDTLSSIAEQHLGRSSRWTEIYDLNKDRLKSPSTLTIGMELKLPPDASGVRVSPAGGFDR